MKTIFNTTRFSSSIRKATLVVATGLLLVASPAFASDAPNPEKNKLEAAVFRVAESLKFKAIVGTAQQEKLSVVIKNENGKIIYSENLLSKGYYRTFDLSSVGDGTYKFEISNGNQTYTQTFQIQTTTVRTVEVN